VETPDRLPPRTHAVTLEIHMHLPLQLCCFPLRLWSSVEQSSSRLIFEGSRRQAETCSGRTYLVADGSLAHWHHMNLLIMRG
jgi:hypothetical protein